ncbi:hypothetical protein H0A36_06935 [Endozoicomonas sp. SM1973]|uniref:Uncharacterized protein n=1 Tax=Spartinivicinus marinus TaxID=2994442 RepID=A0A853HWW3_9GAMM|nr:hypothetical protein [Spartinivicinus marinus]MCX4025750.1 hypothetical protein [Spartinivicinus marinus]NYZ65743.1 hypothetical protein [Spartinivicinus marinus]
MSVHNTTLKTAHFKINGQSLSVALADVLETVRKSKLSPDVYKAISNAINDSFQWFIDNAIDVMNDPAQMTFFVDYLVLNADLHFRELLSFLDELAKLLGIIKNL